jgi:predicted HD phosphohydrolase
MGAEEIACLDGHAWLADALRLRRWDDGAKVAGRVTRPLESWMPLVRSYFG